MQAAVSILLPSSLQCTLNVCQSWISDETGVGTQGVLTSPLSQAIQQVTRELLASTTGWNTGKGMPSLEIQGEFAEAEH
jgi:hypothetical protein